MNSSKPEQAFIYAIVAVPASGNLLPYNPRNRTERKHFDTITDGADLQEVVYRAYAIRERACGDGEAVALLSVAYTLDTASDHSEELVVATLDEMEALGWAHPHVRIEKSRNGFDGMVARARKQVEREERAAKQKLAIETAVAFVANESSSEDPRFVVNSLLTVIHEREVQ